MQESKSLQSEAAEGALLAQDAASGRTTRIFARERSAELYQAASGAAGSLKAANAESGLGVKLRQLVAVATQVSSDLMRLGGASSGEQRVLGRELQAAALESQRIGESLG